MSTKTYVVIFLYAIFAFRVDIFKAVSTTNKIHSLGTKTGSRVKISGKMFVFFVGDLAL